MAELISDQTVPFIHLTCGCTDQNAEEYEGKRSQKECGNEENTRKEENAIKHKYKGCLYRSANSRSPISEFFLMNWIWEGYTAKTLS
jgi:hypothetical protein